MIQMESKLVVADNSGAKIAKCIKVLGGSKKMIAKIGDVIVVSITEALPASRGNNKVKKGQVMRAIIIRTKKGAVRIDNSQIVFDTNAVVLVDKNNEMIGTRVFGPVARELRQKNFSKILSLASEVL